MYGIRYTQEQIDFLLKNVTGNSYKEIINLFYNRFGVLLKFTQIKSFVGNRKLNTGRTGRFEKGHEPLNKGTKGLTGANKTSFKKGNRPQNYRPVGTERINGDGYVDIKIADPNKWKGKHILIWESVNGPLPKNHAVIFGDRNTRNFDINNLILVSRSQLLTLNRNGLIKENTELTKTGVIIADIYQRINNRKKREKK